jgi:hypothetical protein
MIFSKMFFFASSNSRNISNKENVSTAETATIAGSPTTVWMPVTKGTSNMLETQKAEGAAARAETLYSMSTKVRTAVTGGSTLGSVCS